MISELMKRGTTFDGPAITMLRVRASSSYQRLRRRQAGDEFRRLPRARGEQVAVAFERRLEEDLRRIGDRIVRRLEAGERRSTPAAPS